MCADSLELRMTIVMLSHGSNLLICLGRLLLPTLPGVCVSIIFDGDAEKLGGSTPSARVVL
jgi:hypothetical protein